MNIPFEERKLFARYYHAHDCFKQAIDSCLFILGYSNPDKNKLYYFILTAFCVTYCKPFTKNDSIGKISESIVPKDKIHIHKEILNFRNKAIAHLDLDGKVDSLNEYINYIQLHVVNNEASWRGAALIPHIILFEEYKSLCELLMEICRKHIDEFSNKYLPKLKIKSGVYRLNVRDPNGESFMPFNETGIPNSLS